MMLVDFSLSPPPLSLDLMVWFGLVLLLVTDSGVCSSAMLSSELSRARSRLRRLQDRCRRVIRLESRNLSEVYLWISILS